MQELPCDSGNRPITVSDVDSCYNSLDTTCFVWYITLGLEAEAAHGR